MTMYHYRYCGLLRPFGDKWLRFQGLNGYLQAKFPLILIKFDINFGAKGSWIRFREDLNMSFLKRTAALFAALVLLAACVPAAGAVSDASVAAGGNAPLTFTFRDIYSADGTFAVIDPSGIVEDYTITVSVPGSASVRVLENRLWIEPAGIKPQKTSVAVAVDVAIKETAAVGSTCTVVFNGVYSDANEKAGNEYDMYQTAIITVKDKTAESQSASSGSAEPAAKTTDYAELERQLTIAKGLKSAGYTSTSWNALTQAVSKAEAVRKSTVQSEVDAAANSLGRAVAAMKKMDYSQLRQALEQAAARSNAETLDELWLEVQESVEQGKALLTSGDQSAVNAAAGRINSSLAQIDDLLTELKAPQIVEVEVPVEVLPEGDFCNIARHRVWPVLFFISAGVNVVLAVLLVLVIRNRNKRQDTTPLVDYDIEDDFLV